MHKEVLESCERFCTEYLDFEKELKILDVGSYDVNGSLRPLFEKLGQGNWHYDGLDIEEGPNVDIVRKDGKFPIGDNSYDVIVSSSCFEHDIAFWTTFEEMVRVAKNNGYLQISTPSTGCVHRYPLDCWRFYPDAYMALSKWCPEAELIKSYNVGGHFNDLIGIFKILKPTNHEKKWNGEKTTFVKNGLSEKEKKNLVIILSHCDTSLKIKTLKETIASLRSVDVDILLTSHVPISSDIQDMVDYYIFDKSNPLISLRKKRLIRSGRRYLEDLDCFVKLTALIHDQWGGVMNQIIKAADVGLSLDYDYYSFVGYDVTFEEVHLKELNNPCPTEDIVTCEWGDSWIETKRIRNYCSFNKEETETRGQYAGCDFNVMKKDCFKKIRTLLSLERYLEQDSSGNLLFRLAEEYWTSLVYLFKSRFVKEIEEKIQLESFNQNYLDDFFKVFISKGEERHVFFYDIEEPVKFRINNEKIIEVKDSHLEMDVKQIEYLTKDGPYAFSKELEESDSKSQSIELD